jgi:hypothetical protein
MQIRDGHKNRTEYLLNTWDTKKSTVDAKVDLQTQRANTQIDIQSVLVDLTC